MVRSIGAITLMTLGNEFFWMAYSSLLVTALNRMVQEFLLSTDGVQINKHSL